jgi:hypothetical protein
MKRAHRAAHRMLWPILAVAVVSAAALAYQLRPPPEPTTQAASEPAR